MTYDLCMLSQQTALITIEVHSRDVIEKLIKVGCSAATDFEWSSQLRFYWEKEDCLIKQVKTTVVLIRMLLSRF